MSEHRTYAHMDDTTLRERLRYWRERKDEYGIAPNRVREIQAEIALRKSGDNSIGNVPDTPERVSAGQIHD